MTRRNCEHKIKYGEQCPRCGAGHMPIDRDAAFQDNIDTIKSIANSFVKTDKVSDTLKSVAYPSRDNKNMFEAIRTFKGHMDQDEIDFLLNKIDEMSERMVLLDKAVSDWSAKAAAHRAEADSLVHEVAKAIETVHALANKAVDRGSQRFAIEYILEAKKVLEKARKK